ncbi:MAG TPA: AAA family ATPase [Patescibacteria group bacterium]|nr:AAA family ATPase [Patescibacteria group bacterium]
MRVLVTGRAGSGKTAITRELIRRKYCAFDTDDIDGLSAWQEIKSGAKVRFANNSYVDLQKYRWVWDKKILADFLLKHNDVFILGGADNDLSFDRLFDKAFVLDIKPSVQSNRIKTRADNEYGQDPRMTPLILERQKKHLSAALKQNHIRIDVNKPIERVVDELLSYL